MGEIKTYSPKRAGKKRVFYDYQDRKNTTFFVSMKLWSEFDKYSRSLGTVRSRLLEKLIEEEMGK